MTLNLAKSSAESSRGPAPTSTLCTDPSSMPGNTQGYLLAVPADCVDVIRHTHHIPPSWRCVGASKDLCHLAFFAESAESGETNSHYIGVCEAPEGHVYCLFSSPKQSAYTMVIVNQSMIT